MGGRHIIHCASKTPLLVPFMCTRPSVVSLSDFSSPGWVSHRLSFFLPIFVSQAGSWYTVPHSFSVCLKVNSNALVAGFGHSHLYVHPRCLGSLNQPRRGICCTQCSIDKHKGSLIGFVPISNRVGADVASSTQRYVTCTATPAPHIDIDPQVSRQPVVLREA